MMILLGAFNILVTLVVVLVVIYQLTVLVEQYTCLERVGMGLIAAGTILVLGPVSTAGVSPFDDWSGLLLRFGLALHLVGRLTHNWLTAYMKEREAEREFWSKRG